MDVEKSKEQLIEELKRLRQQLLACESSNTQHLPKKYKLESQQINRSNPLDGFTNYFGIQNELKHFQALLEEIADYRMEELTKANKQLQEQIVSRMQVEKDLEIERSRLFSVLDGLPALVYLIAPDHSFRFANHLFREHFGDTEGKPCYKVFRGRTAPCKGCTTFKCGKVTEPHIGEWSYPNGSTYEFYDYPFADIDGTQMLLSFGLDITERKKTENELRLSEERFSKAFNASPIAMSITSLEEGRFIDINASFCQAIGYSQLDIIGKGSLEIGFWIDPHQREIIKQKLSNDEPIRDLEVQFSRKGGEMRNGLLSVEMIKINIEQQPCLLSILNDVTERKQMEIQIARLDRLNLVGEMAASIGHEIRNPMTTVRGFMQILSEKEEYSNDRYFFDLMIEELDRANSIITEFLSLAKNKMLELKSVNLKSLINNIFPLIQANAMMQDKEIVFKVEGEIPDLMLDEKEIRQLTHNLVHNGLEAMPPGGKLKLRLFEEDQYVVLSVQDQGTGIDPRILSKIGTPFFSTKEDGTGLGLAICYGIADRHNAIIDIETGPDGSTFMVIFPKTNSFNPSQQY